MDQKYLNSVNLTPKEKALRDDIIGKLKRHYGRALEEATSQQLYKVVSLTLRDKIMEKWSRFKEVQRKVKGKELYYLSFEFLMGRSLSNNLLNMALGDEYNAVLKSMGLDLQELIDCEPDAGLGNGGLGRLAACFLDSLATVETPSFGSSIRYEYGLFKQKIVDGYQVEMPDPWLDDGTIWEIQRPEEQVEVTFGGRVNSFFDGNNFHFEYENATTVIAVPYDVPITGYNSRVVNTLRLWSARSPKSLDMLAFSGGDYLRATEEKALAEVLSKVLYPEDNHQEGKSLRLRQQYFFVSATMQWVVKRYKKYHSDLMKMPDKIAIHINDTHPALAIPELMRILLDVEGLSWDEAWYITSRCFAYTNHTILSEALEKWPMHIFAELLPRLWMIIDELNNRLVAQLREEFGDDWGKINYMSIVAYNYINMANLCLSTCYAINGVSKLHTDILQEQVFKDYFTLYPQKFNAITNGITYRRWIKLANPELSALISSKIGDEWLTQSDKLKKLAEFAEDPAFQKKFIEVRRKNKERLAKYILEHNNIEIDPDSIFDVQIKRLHEYKRQHLNVLHILHLYNQLKQNPDMPFVPRTFIFGAKASPGYFRAKLIIKLINSVADLVNNDPDISGKLKVVFIENYGVTLAQMIIPATDVSEQISTAGKEASGTGNMKFMLNGALTVGTLDGANVEMLEQVGKDNIFIFGMTAAQVDQTLQFKTNTSKDLYTTNAAIKNVMDMLINGQLAPEKPSLFSDLYNSLLFGDNGSVADPYMVIRDFEAYCAIQEKVSQEFLDKKLWNKKAILNVASAGFFSSDRTIEEYNKKIWKIKKF